MKDSGFNFALVVWALFSIAVIIVGIGFAGGVRNAFTIPRDQGDVAIAFWLGGLVFLISPFLILVIRLLKR